MSLTFSELMAGTLSRDWNKKWRTVESPLVDGVHIPLPDALRDEMAWLERASGGIAVVYGGCFADWEQGRTPKDYDIMVIASCHPLETWARIIGAAMRDGKPFGRYLWRHSLPWKRVRLKTKAGLLDMGCIYYPKDADIKPQLHQIADNADFGVIAAAATLRETLVTERFIDDHKRQVLTCRTLRNVRDYRSGAYKRVPKYAGKKYADWPVEFDSPADARFFAPLIKERNLLGKVLEKENQRALYDLIEKEYLSRYGIKRPRPSITI